MLARLQVDGEGHVFVSDQVPPQSAERVADDVGDFDTLPGKPLRLPCLSIAPPSEDGVVSDEEQQLLFFERADTQHRTIGNLAPLLWLECVDQIGIAAGNRAEPLGIGTTPNAGGCGRIGETQRTGREKRIAACWFY